MTATNAPILLLHSSCKDAFGHDGNITIHEGPSLAPTTTADGKDEPITTSDMDRLTTLPIQCDMMLLPEFHTAATMASMATSSQSASSPSFSSLLQPLHLSGTSINPCGTSNVIVLEHLPWNDGISAAQHNPGSVLLSLTSCSVMYRPDMDATTFQLPIEPQPSAFVVDFNDKANSEGRLAELSVEFDFDKASSIVVEMLQVEESASPSAADGNSGDDMEPDPLLHQPESCRRDQEDPPEFGAKPPSGQDQLFASIKDLDERKLLLHELHLRIERDSLSLDRHLQTLACISVVLLGVLAWAIYQYCQSNAKSDAQASEIRASMKKTRRVLREAIEDWQPRSLEQDFNHERVRQDASHETKIIQQHHPARQWPSPSERNADDRSVDSNQLLHGDRENDHQEVAPQTPQKATASIQEVPTKNDRPSPYTYERFAKEWMERKTIRRSNRKKRSYLRPITLPSDVPPVPVNRTQSQSSSEGSQQILGPPKLLSVVRGNAKNGVCAKAKSVSCASTDDSGKPPVSNVSYINKPPHDSSLTPSLCYTPASEDDSFIEDYWF